MERITPFIPRKMRGPTHRERVMSAHLPRITLDFPSLAQLQGLNHLCPSAHTNRKLERLAAQLRQAADFVEQLGRLYRSYNPL